MSEKFTDREAGKLNQWAQEFADINRIPSDPDEAHDDLDELPARPRQVIPAADRELLELAARALGAVHVEDVDGEEWLNLHFADGSTVFHWNPLLHGDDTFNLQVDLELLVNVISPVVYVEWQQIGTGDWYVQEEIGGDKKASARRAVTRAAAEIGKAMAC